MKKVTLLGVFLVVFSWASFSTLCMESQDEGQGNSQKATSIIYSHFSDNPEYLNTLEQLLEDYKYPDGLNAIERLIYAASKEIGDLTKYVGRPFSWGELVAYQPQQGYSSVPSLKELSIRKITSTCNTEELANCFRQWPITGLEGVLGYPGFSPEQKLSIFQAARMKQFGDKVEFWPEPQSPIDGLEINELKGEFVKKYSYCLRHKDYCCSNKNDYCLSNEEAPLIYLHALYFQNEQNFEKLKSYLEKGGNPFSFLQQAVLFFSKNGTEDRHSLYSYIIDYAFKHYPLYTAIELVRLATETRNTSEQKTALGIVNAHNLLQYVIDNDRSLIEDCDVDLLVILKAHGVDFSNPELIDWVVQSKNYSCLSFILDQQKGNLPQEPGFYCDLINDSVGDYHRSTRKAFLRGRESGDMRSLEEFFLLTKKLDNVVKRALQRSDTNSVDEALKEFSSNYSLSFFEEYPVLKNYISTVNRNGNNRYALNLIRDRKGKYLGPNSCWSVLGVLATGYLMYYHFCDDDTYSSPLSLGNVAIEIGLLASLAYFGRNCHDYAKKYYREHEEIVSKVFEIKKYNYLEGYLKGLNGKQADSSEEERCKNSVIKTRLWRSASAPLAFGLFYAGLIDIYNLGGGLTISALCKLFMGGISPVVYGWKDDETVDEAVDAAKKLFKIGKERGKRDGFARIQKFNSLKKAKEQSRQDFYSSITERLKEE